MSQDTCERCPATSQCVSEGRHATYAHACSPRDNDLATAAPALREIAPQHSHSDPDRGEGGQAEGDDGQYGITPEGRGRRSRGEQGGTDDERRDHDAGGDPVGQLLRTPYDRSLVQAFQAKVDAPFRE